MQSVNKKYEYNIVLLVVDFHTTYNEILKTTFLTDDPVKYLMSPGDLAARIDLGVETEFEILTVSNETDVHPVIATLKGVKSVINDKNKMENTIYGEIVLIDGLRFRPYDQMGDVYDNIWACNFNMSSFYFSEANGSVHSYDGEVEGSEL